MVKSKNTRTQMKALKSLIFTFLPFILIAIVVLLSLEKTLQYYFYTDDFAFLYYLQNHLNFGWPYNSVLPLFTPVYNLFGTNPLPWFSLSVFTYFISSIALYFFVRQLTSNKIIALFSSLIFATGYIGLDQFSMIAVSIVDNLNIINMSITLILLTYWINTKRLRFYLLTFLMFWFSVNLFPYRAFPLVLFLPTVELVESFKLEKLSKILKKMAFIILRYIPFVVVASHYGIFSYSRNTSESAFRLIIGPSSVLGFINFGFLKQLFAVLGRFIFPKPASDIFTISPDLTLYAVIGLAFFLLVIFISLLYSHTKRTNLSRSLIIFLFLTIEGYFGYMILNADFDSNGPFNRYLTTSFLPFAAVIPLFLFFLFEKINIKKNKLLFTGTVLFIILVFSSLSREYENFVIENRSLPAREFYKSFENYIPRLSGTNIFYFDNALYYPIPQKFGSVLLGAAMDRSVNIAVPYKVPIKSVKIVDSFDRFLFYLMNPPAPKVSYYTFYDDEKGLHSTTNKVFTLLKNGSQTEIPGSAIDYQKGKGLFAINLKTRTPSLTPIKVDFEMTASPLDSGFFNFPYIFSSQNNASSISDYYEKNNIQKQKIFDYLLSREDYYKTVKVDVESIHIAKQNPASFLIDDNPDTYWLSDESRWQVNINPWVKLDLGEARNIGRLIWRQLPNRVITGFVLETSLDGNSWEKINNIKRNSISSDSDLIINDFPSVNARYIKLTITSLQGGRRGPGPGLAEIEAVEDRFKDINLNAAIRIKDNPFEYIKDSNDLALTYKYLEENSKLSVRVITNKSDPAGNSILEKLPIFLDGKQHGYELVIPQGGTELKTIILESNFPANFSVSSVTLTNLTQDVLFEQIREECANFAKEKSFANPFECK